jgi:type 1 glutamine amidotransferase
MIRFDGRFLAAARSVLILPLLLGVFPMGVAAADDPWIELPGGDGPGAGKHVVLIAADDEYRSEELIPALAQILSKRLGFRCTVLFAIDPASGAIDPSVKDNIPGLDALKTADLMVMFLRFRDLPDDQMKTIMDYVNSGRPIVSLRTNTHPFNFAKHKEGPYGNLDWRSKEPSGGFGRMVLGETWVSHWGKHKFESTRAVPADGAADSPILRGVGTIWGPSDVYEAKPVGDDVMPILTGVVLKGMKPDDEPQTSKATMPVAWTKTFKGSSGKPSRVFVTTMGHAGDFRDENFRRVIANACLWAVGREDQIPAKADVSLVAPYEPSDIGDGGHRKGLRPSDLAPDH